MTGPPVELVLELLLDEALDAVLDEDELDEALEEALDADELDELALPMVPPIPLELLELSLPAAPPAPVTRPPAPDVAVVSASPEHPDAQRAVATNNTHEERIEEVFMAALDVIIVAGVFRDLSMASSDNFELRQKEIFPLCKNALRRVDSW